MKKAGNILLMILVCTMMQAQSNSIFLPFNQYMFNTLLYNPAYAGTKESFSVTAIYRKQWMSVKGAPEMQALSAHTPLRNNKIAIGIHVDNLSAGAGAERGNNLMLYYSYRFIVGPGKLSLGLRAGGTMISKNLTGIDRKDNSDAAFVDEAFIMPNFGVGAYYYSDLYYLGFSVPFLLCTKDAVRGFTHDFRRYNLTGTAGVLFRFTENFRIKPSGYIQYTIDNPVLYYLSSSFIFIHDAFWITGSYKSTGDVIGILEFQLSKQLRLGYSYDFAVGYLKGFMSGSHEILMRYDFSYSVRAQNPAYFW